MYELFSYLKSIEDKYIRTIFNFHIKKCDELANIYSIIKTKIESETNFNDVVDTKFNNYIKKLIYCDINITKHIINQSSYSIKPRTYKKSNKLSQHFEISLVSDTPSSLLTKEIFTTDKSSLISYIKTTNKKYKIDYGELKKTINSHNGSVYYSGKRSDEYMSTEVHKDKNKPWIKSISKKLTLYIENQSITTRGKSSILQTIEIIYTNRTCIKIFKDSTIHVILSKDKTETSCADTVNKLFSTYKILFDFIHSITGNNNFLEYKDVAEKIVTTEDFNEKINMIKEHYDMYGIQNFKIGMFNITYKLPINTVIFPSLMVYNSKIKFFKGKKLNIVALSSLKECKKYVQEAENILHMMREKSKELEKIDVVTVSVETLKNIIVSV
ncbi:CNPV262 intermediate transcription factor VITF-3 [Canarypox virus]|uniref:Intermediate transcription factor 3 large subunit n=2 Tax=Canarypox virus TaxID=44088 RepID=A0A1V0QGL1_CNPV|nr:CNPV262 intermediate transcription factor VITF-3 [Canarypox virus]ARE67499.1 SWPV2-ORF248 [Shearwaterpox virus]QRM15541.1 intermediate transcription factor VITF-3 [Mudlarkpox virus]QRM15894.1 intermediate transcription factor vitf-3 [Penguinpox virus 2]QRM16231.1 intermediate transcription factor vitf-3 [Albatrosspox virus]AAR83608.1 CNPV262 intermediate transcription factor VITF-3 [Canarypox virus]